MALPIQSPRPAAPPVSAGAPGAGRLNRRSSSSPPSVKKSSTTTGSSSFTLCGMKARTIRTNSSRASSEPASDGMSDFARARAFFESGVSTNDASSSTAAVASATPLSPIDAAPPGISDLSSNFFDGQRIPQTMTRRLRIVAHAGACLGSTAAM